MDLLELEAAFQLYSLLADENVVRIAKNFVADVGDQSSLRKPQIVDEGSARLARESAESERESARILPALVLNLALLVGSSSLRCVMILEWVVEVARLQQENSAIVENSLLRRPTMERILRHWDLAMIVVIAGLAFLKEQSEHALSAGLEQVVLLVAD